MKVLDRAWIKLVTLDLQSDTYLQSDTLQTALRGLAITRYGVGIKMPSAKVLKNQLCCNTGIQVCNVEILSI